MSTPVSCVAESACGSDALVAMNPEVIRGSDAPVAMISADRREGAAPTKATTDRREGAAPTKATADRREGAAPTKPTADRWEDAAPTKSTADRREGAAPTKPTLVFLHGIGGRASAWAAIQQACAQAGYASVAWDMPGYGDSPMIEPCTFDGLADALAALMDAQGLQQAVLVGHSLGGMVALQMWARHPERVAGLVLAASSPGFGQGSGDFQKAFIAQRAPDGCITIVGRSKDMVISGGENIYSAEIENQLVTLPGVAVSAVVGVADERWGEVPVAVLVRSGNAAGQALDTEAVLDHLQSRIARFKLPRRVVFLDSLPKSALGKVHKPALQQLLTNP